MTVTFNLVRIEPYLFPFASTANGQRFVGLDISGERLYTSANYGTAFKASSTAATIFGSDKYLSAFTMDLSGQYVVVGSTKTSKLYRSVDYGASFTVLSASPTFSTVYYMTGDGAGQHLVVVGKDTTAPTPHSIVYYSSDSGANWSQSTLPNGATPWVPQGFSANQICSSSNGQYVFLNTSGGVLKSNDYGATFTAVNDTGDGIACNSTGQYVLIAYGTGGIFRSTNYGESSSYAQLTGAATNGDQVYSSISSDSTGTYLVVADRYNYRTYSSSDAGVTWVEEYTYRDMGSSATLMNTYISYDHTVVYSQTDYYGMYLANRSQTSNFTLLPYNTYLSPFITIPSTNIALGADASGQLFKLTGNGQISEYTTITANVFGGTPGGIIIAMDSMVGGYYIIVGSSLSNVLYYSNANSDFKYFYPLNSPTFDPVYCISGKTSGGSYWLVSGNIDGAKVYYTNNGGDNFYQSTLPGSHSVIAANKTICMSSDGTKMYILTQSSSNGVCKSTDYGHTFTAQTGSPSTSATNANSIVCDSTGQYVYVACGVSGIYSSSDYGVTWAQTPAPTDGDITYTSIDCDSSGRLLAVADLETRTVWTSSDHGSSWVHEFTPGSSSASDMNVAIDGYGYTVYSSVKNVGLYVNLRTTSYKFIKSPSTTSTYFTTLVCNPDGTTVVGVADTGGFSSIYKSTNSGRTFTVIQSVTDIFGGSPSLSELKITALVMANNGTKILVGCDTSASLYLSTDGGTTFSAAGDSPTFDIVYGLTSDQNGTHFVVTASLSSTPVVYYSANSGTNWSASTLPSDCAPATTNTLCMSADGSLVYLIGTNASSATTIFISSGSRTAYGNTFVELSGFTGLSGSPVPHSICCDLYGTKIFAACGTAGVYVSVNSGADWTKTEANTSGSQSYTSVSCDSTGTYIIAADTYHFYTYYSFDGGSGNAWILSTAGADGNTSMSVLASYNSRYLFSQVLASGLYVANRDFPLNLVGAHYLNQLHCDQYAENIVGTSENKNTLYISYDYGTSFKKATTALTLFGGGSISAVGQASSGQFIYLGSSSANQLYYSTDYGYAFGIVNGSPTLDSVYYIKCCDNVAQHVIVSGVVSSSPVVYYTSNSGTSWTLSALPGTWLPISDPIGSSIASAADATKIYAIAINSDNAYSLLYSSDSGANFSELTTFTALNKHPTAIACDSTGAKIVVSCGISGIYRSTNSGSSWTLLTTPSASDQTYVSIACDATGQHIITGDGNNYKTYLSYDCGTTWVLQATHGAIGSGDFTNFVNVAISDDSLTLLSETNKTGIFYASRQYTRHFISPRGEYFGFYYPIQCSSNGQKLVLIGDDGIQGYIYTSSDYGNTLTVGHSAVSIFGHEQTENNSFFSGYAINADATKIVIGSGEADQLARSTDGGSTFTILRESPFFTNVYYINSDSTGDNLVVCGYDISGNGNNLYYSRNGGTSWNTSTVTGGLNIHFYIRLMCSSSDGSKVYLLNNASGVRVFKSSDYGQTFTSLSGSAIDADPPSISCNSTGTIIAVACQTQGIYISSNSGSTWSAASVPLDNSNYYEDVSVDSTGQYIAAIDKNNLRTYISSDYGVTWTKVHQGTYAIGPYGSTTISADHQYIFSQYIGGPGIYVGTQQNLVCFKEDTKILCKINGVEEYIPIQALRKGDLVKTLLDRFKPIDMIGRREIYHTKHETKIANQLYVCPKENFPEATEDLVITGTHSILIDEITAQQRTQIIDLLGKIYATDDKYRVPACLDERTRVYEKEGLHNIYHFALENDNYYMNYGIYANGILVETSSKRYLKEISRMSLIK